MKELTKIREERLKSGTYSDSLPELDVFMDSVSDEEDSHDDSDSNPGFGDKYLDHNAMWIRPYLLEMEANNKEPPYLAFEEYRGLDNDMHLNISFKTEKFQKWVYN